MPTLTKAMRKYLTGETRRSYKKDVQSVYDSRLKHYARTGLDDLILLAENVPPSWRQEIFEQDKLRKLLKALLAAKEADYNEYVNDIWAYKTVLGLLRVIHGALNEILNPQKIGDMKRLEPNITRWYYTNISALEMMLIVFSGELLEKG